MTIKSKLASGIRSLMSVFKEEKVVPIAVPVNAEKILEGKIALITGGSGGIGFAIAQAFVNSGAKVVLCGTNAEKLANYCSQLENTKPLVLDITRVDQMNDKLNEALALFENSQIDILVNCAGVISKCSFSSMSEEEWNRVIDINLKGTVFMCQVVSNYMIENGIKGHILNVSSASSLRPANNPYSISKWGIKGFTLGLADILLPYGIIVNAIAPGPVATAMLGKGDGSSNISCPTAPSKRFAMPSEIANLATFMVSDMGQMIVGDTFYMTGGGGTISLHN